MFKRLCAALFLLGMFCANDSTKAEDSLRIDSNVILYTVSFCNEPPTLTFDGWRVEPLAKDVAIDDRTGSGVRNVSELSDLIGLGPGWDVAKIGDTIGTDLGDAIYADVESVNDEIVKIALLRREARPLVGVSWTGVNEIVRGQRVISDSLLRNGMRAYLIPQIKSEEDCEKYLSTLQGFVMPGGVNFNPKHYGEAPYPHGAVGMNDARDTHDVLATRWIVAHNIPGLWFCRGVQALNVALGGALIQDVPTYQAQRVLKGEIPFEKARPIPDEGVEKGRPCVPAHYRVLAHDVEHNGSRHAIEIVDEFNGESGSKFLRPIVGSNSYPSVLTWHHQAAGPERLGKDLTIVAYSPDGIVEALEYQMNDFALGTQFHPEYDTLSGDKELQRFGNSFFKELLKHIRLQHLK